MRFKQVMRPSAPTSLVAVALTLASAATFVSGCGSTGSSTSTQAANSRSSASSTASSGGFGLSPVSSVTALVPASLKSKGSLTDAIYDDAPPEAFRSDGPIVGIQPDLTAAISEVTGLEFSMVPVGSFDSIIPGLQGGRYDVAFADFGITAAREKVVDFVEEFSLGTSFAVKQGSSTAIRSGSDLCGLRLGTLAGSYFFTQAQSLSHACIAAGKNPIAIQAFPTQSAAVLAVTTGRTDVYADSSDQIAYDAQQSATRLSAQPFAYQQIPQGIGLPKGSRLGPVIQAALKQLVADGVYAKIMRKWGVSSASIPAAMMQLNPRVS